MDELNVSISEVVEVSVAGEPLATSVQQRHEAEELELRADGESYPTFVQPRVRRRNSAMLVKRPHRR